MHRKKHRRPTRMTTGVRKRMQNLRPPWEPGQSGNPSGKKPGTLNHATAFWRAFEGDFGRCTTATFGNHAEMIEGSKSRQVAVLLRGVADTVEEFPDDADGVLASCGIRLEDDAWELLRKAKVHRGSVTESG